MALRLAERDFRPALDALCERLGWLCRAHYDELWRRVVMLRIFPYRISEMRLDELLTFRGVRDIALLATFRMRLEPEQAEAVAGVVIGGYKHLIPPPNAGF